MFEPPIKIVYDKPKLICPSPGCPFINEHDKLPITNLVAFFISAESGNRETIINTLPSNTGSLHNNFKHDKTKSDLFSLIIDYQVFDENKTFK